MFWGADAEKRFDFVGSVLEVEATHACVARCVARVRREVLWHVIYVRGDAKRETRLDRLSE